MNLQFTNEVAGERLGVEGLDQLVERVEAVCEWERTRIGLANQAAILAKQAEYSSALEEEGELRVRLYRARPPHEMNARRRRIASCWVVASLLIVAGFVLSLLTLEPYRLGLKGVFYCLGVALVTPFLVERTLELFSSDTLKRALTVVSCLGALASLMLLAVIRGELMGQEIRQPSAPVVIEGEEEPRHNQTKNSFYEETVPLLQLVMALLAFSMEMGAGIAAHEAERISENQGENYQALRRELGEVQSRLGLLVQEIVALQNEAAIFVATFWRDFYWAMLKRTLRSAAKRFVLPAVGLLLMCPVGLRAQVPLELVVALDLSASVGRKGPDGRTEFERNVAVVSQLLARVPAGAHVTILGITDKSFAQPYFLLSATLGTDEGYFGEKLNAARQQLVHSWQARSHRLEPSFRHTDVLGALLVASQVFKHASGNRKRILLIFSDMQQETKELNVETPRDATVEEEMDRIRQQQLLADLNHVDVHVLGAEAGRNGVGNWAHVQQFWVAYFKNAGANLKGYSILREPPGLEP